MSELCTCGSGLMADLDCDGCGEFFCAICVNQGLKRTLCDGCAEARGVCDHADLMTGEADAAAEIARVLLTRSGWSGSDLDFLERVWAREESDPDTLTLVTEMKDQREREEELRR